MHPSMVSWNILGKQVTNNGLVHAVNMSDTSMQIQSSNQESFSSKTYLISEENIKVFVSSWNVGGKTPPDSLELEELTGIQNSTADIYVFGFQEIVPLNAGNILVSEKGNNSTKWNSLIEGALNTKAATEDRLRNTEIEETQRIYPVKTQTSTDTSTPPFECIISKQMVGIYITVWARTGLHGCISHPSVSCVGCGFLGCLGNKGSVSVRFCLHETSFCFVCSHLASGGKEGDEMQRNTDAANIMSRTLFPSESLQHLPRKILDHEYVYWIYSKSLVNYEHRPPVYIQTNRVIWLGDLNYRIYLPEDTTRFLVKNKEWSVLLENDQLKTELTKGHVFDGWNEKAIDFAPTYKYDRNSDDYYGSDNRVKVKRRRAPAWCDRIIWFGQGLKQTQYSRGESRLSDHRPVRAIFNADVRVSRPIMELGRILSKQIY